MIGAGRQTKLNIKARKKIAEISERKNIIACEVHRSRRCMGQAHDPAHRHERDWYKGKPEELLWDYSQWVGACRCCHDMLDGKGLEGMSKEEREEVFILLRGEETIPVRR